MKSFNINDMVKVKLNEVGLAIYANKAIETNKELVKSNIEYRCSVSPETDDKGFVKFQLWDLMVLYGKHLRLALASPFEDNKIYFEDDNLEEVINE